MGNNITSIGKSAFENCSSLISIEIPQNITSIGGNAFSYCSSLTSIELPNNLTQIEYGMFNNCINLTSVVIGKKVNNIGSGAFDRYSYLNLQKAYYKGTAQDWSMITIDIYNEALTNATIYYYSEAEPELNSDKTAYDGNYWHYDTNGNIVEWKKEN